MQSITSLNSFSEELDKSLSQMMQDISSIEEKYENDDFVSDIEYFIEKYNSHKGDEKLITMDCHLPNTNQNMFKKQPELNIQSLQNISTLPITRKIHKDVEDAKNALISFKKTINNVSKETKLKISMTKKKLELYFDKNSLEVVKKKTLEKLFGSINGKNRLIIRKLKNILEGKNGFHAFKALMELTFEEMYDYYKEDCKLIFYNKKLINLTGKFDTLKDVMKKNNKNLRRLKLNTIKAKSNNNVDEAPMEVEKEVFAILID